MEEAVSMEEIEKYIEGKLSKEDLIAFEEQLATNKELAEKVKLLQGLKQSLANVQTDLNFIQKVKHINNDYQQEQRFARRRIFRYAAAASILILIGIFTFQQFTTETLDVVAMANEQEAGISLVLNTTTLGGSNQTFFEAAKEAYDTSGYELAKEKIEAIEIDTAASSYSDYLKLKAAIYYKTKDYNKSIAIYEDLRYSVDELSVENIILFQAYAYIQVGDYKKAKENVEYIVNLYDEEGGKVYRNAKELQKALQKE